MKVEELRNEISKIDFTGVSPDEKLEIISRKAGLDDSGVDRIRSAFNSVRCGFPAAQDEDVEEAFVRAAVADIGREQDVMISALLKPGFIAQR